MEKHLLLEYFDRINTDARIELCKKTAQALSSFKKRYNKACAACDRHNGTQVSKSKRATLDAKRETLAKECREHMEILKLFVAKL